MIDQPTKSSVILSEVAAATESKDLRFRRRSRLASIIPFQLGLIPLTLLTACRPHDFPQYPPNYREYAYVTNQASGTVTVLDVVDVRVDREISTGPNPVAVIASPSRNEVYVVNSGSPSAQGSVSIINAAAAEAN